MTHYIDAEKLVEHLYKMLEKYPKNYQILVILEYIDSIQLKQPKVDLEKEIKRYLREECSADDEPSISDIARHFYELGLNARKED